MGDQGLGIWNLEFGIWNLESVKENFLYEDEFPEFNFFLTIFLIYYFTDQLIYYFTDQLISS